MELLQPNFRRIISLKECDAAALSAKSYSESDNKIQAMKFNFRYDEIRYNDARMHSSLLHSVRSSPECDFVIIPRSHDAVIDVVAGDVGMDGGMEKISLRAETVAEKVRWLEAVRPFLCKDPEKTLQDTAEDISVVSGCGASLPDARRRPADSKSRVLDAVESLERGMGKMRLYGLQFAISTSHKSFPSQPRASHRLQSFSSVDADTHLYDVSILYALEGVLTSE
jgi:hypothetical protein